MQPLDLVAIALATFYVAVAMTKSGPWRVFDRLRDRLPHGGLLSCAVCLSVWISVAFYVLSLAGLAVVVYAIAPAGAAVLAWRYTGGDHI